MKWAEVASFAQHAERHVGIPAGTLYAIARAESGAPQHSSRSFSFAEFDPMSRRVEPGFYDQYIRGTEWESSRWGMVPEVVAASYGICQVMYTTAVWALRKGMLKGMDGTDIWDIGRPWSLFDPAVNLRVGAEVFAYKARKYGSLAAGASAYNAGSPRPMASGIFVNQSYVDNVRAGFPGGAWPSWRADA